MAADPHRPRYHFLAPSNWINDPHGMVQWNGAYHLFYQYNPHGPFHGTIHWGHAVSDDLVHWRDLPIALAPEAGLYDQDGCWTGCLVNDGGVPTIYYTATHPQTVAAAVSHNGLLTWQKLPENPLLDGPPEAIRPLAGGHFRDPFIWRAPGGWEMLMASKIEGRGGQFLLYASKDLRHWQYRGIFLGGDAAVTEPFWQGTMWECPNYLDFGERQVVLASVQSTPTDHLYTAYFTGTRQGDRFEPLTSDLLVHGGSFYAPQVMRTGDGRWIMLGWLHEGRSQQACMEAGWNGAHSLPLELDLLPDGSLSLTPAREVRSLRGVAWQENSLHLSGEMLLPLSGAGGKALEIEISLRPGEDAACGLQVLASPGGEEKTNVIYDRQARQLFVEREHSSLDQRADVNPATMPLELGAGETLQLRLFVDHSVLELFANGLLCLACRVYPTREDSRGLALFSRRGQTAVESMRVWPMEAIWPSA